MKKKHELGTYFVAAVGALGSLLAIGSFTYHYLEKWTWIDAVYFTVATLATVGYGDLHPTTQISRLFTIFFILIGVSISVTAIAVIGGNYLAKKEDDMIRMRDERIAKKNRQRE